MKQNIHPKWYPEAKFTCACGNSFVAGSTVSEVTVDICSKCHPFFTGEQRFIDTLGRVEKFQVRQKKALAAKYVKKSDRKRQKIEKEKAEEKARPKSLREMLGK